jgi:methionine synthase II (cobalamin-independent)
MTSRAWRAGSATGLGSLPGTDPDEAVRLVLGEVADLPYLPELPARGLGADMVGRTAALLVDLPVEWKPHGWTIASHFGRDARQARDFLSRDLDALTMQGQDLDVVKVQICGPATLGASIELPNLHKLLTDHGAFRDLAASLAEGARLHVADLKRRLPRTRIILQVDEPSLPAALAGAIPTPSGYGTVRSLNRAIAEPVLTDVLSAADIGHRVVHCCAADAPLDLLAAVGASAISVDADRLRNADLDTIGELIDNGVAIWLGIIPGADAAISRDKARSRVLDFWQRLGFSREMLPESVVPTPSCGLAGASPAYVRRAMSVLRDVGEALRD